MERILSVKKVENVKVDKIHDADGYEITTDKQTIKMLIDNGQACCETWGYFMSEDNLESFVGANLHSVTVTDTALNTIVFEEYLSPDDMDSGGMMFVNINTDRGMLQFVAYNAHNGYYGHAAYVISDDFNHSEYL